MRAELFELEIRCELLALYRQENGGPARRGDLPKVRDAHPARQHPLLSNPLDLENLGQAETISPNQAVPAPCR